MAAFNYAKMGARAVQLVQRYGTTVTLRRLDNTPSDPAKPHLGPVDPEANATELAGLYAVFVEPSDTSKLGTEIQKADWLKRAQKIAIVAAVQNPEDYSTLVDADGTVWRIEGVSTLRPGSITLLHFVGVSR